MSIHLSKTDGGLILKPASSILKSRRIKFQLSGPRFRGIFDEQNDELFISAAESQLEGMLVDLVDLFGLLDNTLTLTREVEELIVGFKQEKLDFIERVDLAAAVWDGKLESEQLAEFTSTLKSRFVRTLYPKQLLSSFHIACSRHACNFSVPGAGKSSILLGAYSYHSTSANGVLKQNPMLIIVGPLSSFGSWDNEWKGCFGVEGNLRRLSGIDKSQKDSFFEEVFAKGAVALPDAILMHYQTMASEQSRLAKLFKMSDVMFVVDEAHYIKNTEDGVWSQAALGLSPLAKSRVLLTGTPAPNGYEDLYNLMKFLWPKEHVLDFHPNQLAEISKNPYDSRIPIIKESIKRWYTRICKRHILPEKLFPVIERRISVEMDESQAEIYEGIKSALKNQAHDLFETPQSNSLFRALLIRLMQCATSPNNVFDALHEERLNQGLSPTDEALFSMIEDYGSGRFSEKYTALLQICKDVTEEGQKVLIWCNFRYSVSQVTKFLIDSGIAAVSIHDNANVGSLDLLDNSELQSELDLREEILNEFRYNSNVSVLVATAHIMAESVSLHKWCNHAIYFERDWNAAKFIQSKDRIHRVGLEEGTSTHYYYLIAKNTVEEKLDKRLDDKVVRMMALLESDEVPLFELLESEESSSTEWREILRDYVQGC